MKREIKDYLHLYLGCEAIVSVPNGKEIKMMVNRLDVISRRMKTALYHLESGAQDLFEFANIKPILRPLFDMTREEWVNIRDEVSHDVSSSVGHPDLKFSDKPKWVLVLENRLNTNTLRFNDGMILLRMGFDLFGLIESGLAISKTNQ